MNKQLNTFQLGEWTNDAIYASLKHQRNVAYAAASLFAVISILAVGAVILMMPLKQDVPWLIRENTLTGEFTFPDRITEENYESLNATTVKFAYEYLKSRERFNVGTMEEDIGTVYLLTSSGYIKEYEEYLEQPNSPMKLGRSDKRDFALRTLIPLDEGLLQMRFTTVDYKNGIKQTPLHWLGTIRYSYNKENVPEDKEHKFVNPVGFMVTEYLKEPEILQEVAY